MQTLTTFLFWLIELKMVQKWGGWGTFVTFSFFNLFSALGELRVDELAELGWSLTSTPLSWFSGFSTDPVAVA